MTNISSLVLIIICVAIGYIFEPIFFSDSNSSPVKPVIAPADVDEPDPDADPHPDPEPEDDGLQADLSQITQADYPEKPYWVYVRQHKKVLNNPVLLIHWF